MPENLTAREFIDRLAAHCSPEDREKLRRSTESGSARGEVDTVVDVRTKLVFDLAKEFIDMPPGEIEKLLANPIHKVRVGALSIMDKQARRKKTPESRRKELFELYIGRHDMIDDWDLVDVAAPYVVGGYLFDKSRDILYKLARSKNLWERRTAIVATYFFIRQDDLADTFKIGDMLAHDEEHFVQTAVGGWVREAGKRDKRKLLAFLDKHAATMPRTALRYAIEHLDKDQRAHYLNLKSNGG